jgi:hypothetical protein
MNDRVLIAILPVVVTLTIVLVVVAIRRRAKETPVDQARLREVQADWRAPDELQSHAPPRNVRYEARARAAFVLAVVAAVGVVTAAAFLGPIVLREQRDQDLVRREGIPGTGVITRRWTTQSKSTSYHVAYAYDVGNTHYEAEAGVSRANYDRFTVGATAGIHYAPSRPDVSRMDDASSVPAWLKLLVFLPALLLLAIPWRVAQMKRLLAWGTPTGAVVTRSGPTKGGLAIRYKFLDPTGEVVTGSEVVSSRGAPQAGDVITVLVDPDRPRRAARYPLSMVRLGE